MNETIVIKTSSDECLNQITVQVVVDFYRRSGNLKEIMGEILDVIGLEGWKKLLKQLVDECLSVPEVVAALGADAIVEECSVRIEEAQANVNASDREG